MIRVFGKHGFFKQNREHIYNICMDEEMTCEAGWIYTVLTSMANEEGIVADKSQSLIMSCCHMSPKRFRKNLKLLEEQQYIVITRHFDPSTKRRYCTYQLGDAKPCSKAYINKVKQELAKSKSKDEVMDIISHLEHLS